MIETEVKVAADYPYFSDEHVMLRDTVREFCRKELAPHTEEWDEAGIFPRDVFKKAGDLGLFGIRIDPQFGGSGLDWWATTAYLEGLSYASNGGVQMALMVQSDITLPVLDELGTDEQKEEFLKPAVAGDYIAALGISEPGGGSDVASLKTRARIDGDDFVISGQKLWITNGTRADFIILAVRTGEEGHRGISMVIFPTNTKGFAVGKKLKKVGNLSSDTAELFFDNCRIREGIFSVSSIVDSITRCTIFRASVWRLQSAPLPRWNALWSSRSHTGRSAKRSDARLDRTRYGSIVLPSI